MINYFKLAKTYFYHKFIFYKFEEEFIGRLHVKLYN